MPYTENKNVIVTGCSSGIGKATASLLKENGWRVFATARSQKDVNALLQEGFEACKLDLEDSCSIRHAFDFILSKTEGKLYALINNAGFGLISAIEDLEREEMRKQFETNVFGPQELTNLAIQVFRKQGFGRVVTISSLVGKIPLPFTGAYCASKFALEALSDAMAMELNGTNIHISLIELGSITKTEFNKNAIEKLYKKSTETSYHKQAYKNIAYNTRMCMDKAKNNTVKNENCPYIIARAVENILKSKKPRMRYFIRLKWMILWFAAKILPQNILNGLIKKYRQNTFKQQQ